MFRVKLPGLPDANGRLLFGTVELQEDGRTLCAYLGLSADEIAHVVYKGGPLTGAELEAATPAAGDEFHVFPAIGTRYAPLILGAIGGIIGAYFGNPQLGYAIGAAIGAYFVPRPKAHTAETTPTTFVWSGYTNDRVVGSAKPVLLGRCKTDGVRIGEYRRRIDETREEYNVLLLVSHGGRAGVQGPVMVQVPGKINPRNGTEMWEDVRINNQHVSNFPNVKIDYRLGVAGQDVIPGFNAIRTTFNLAQKLNSNPDASGSPFVYTTAGEVDAFTLLLDFPSGLSHTDKHGTGNNRMRYQVRYRQHNAPTWTFFGIIPVSAATRARYLTSSGVTGLARARYDIEVTAVGADEHDTSSDTFDLFLTGVTEEKNDERRYEKYALLSVSAIATELLSGQRPVVTSVWDGIKVPVWNNGVWSDPVFTRLTAWSVCELIRNTEFGLFRQVPGTDANLDLPAWAEWGGWCAEDTTVTPSEGAPYTEQRAYLDIVLNQQQNAWDTLTQLAATARCVLIPTGNQIRPVVDKPDLPAQLVSMGNVKVDPETKRSLFSVLYKSETQYNAYTAQWLSERKDWAPDPRLIVDPIRVTQQGQSVRTRSIALIGITREGQLYRETYHRLSAERELRRTIQFPMSTDGVLHQAGDVISFQHDVAQWGWGGRLLEGSTATDLIPDQPLEVFEDVLQPGTALPCKIKVRPTDGSNDAGELRDVVPFHGPGIYEVVRVAPALSSMPVAGDVYAFGDPPTKDFRVIDIARDGDSHRFITALEHADLSDDGTTVVTSSSQLPRYGAPPGPIVFLSVTEEFVTQFDGSVLSNLLIQWSRPADNPAYGAYRGASVEISYDLGATWPLAMPTVDGLSYRWMNVPHGVTVVVRVTPYSAEFVYNRAGAKVSLPFTTQGWKDGPPAPSGFTIISQQGAFVASWGEVSKDVEYELRAANPSNWKTDKTGFVYRGRSQTFRFDKPLTRAATGYLRAVDRFDNYSAAAATATVSDAPPAAPTLTGAVRLKEGIRVSFAPPPSTPDIIALYLHASTDPNFAPSATNRVAQVVSPQGGDFFFQTSNPATYYFYATAADWFTERLGDYVYSQRYDTNILTITPASPSGITTPSPAPSSGKGHAVAHPSNPDATDGALAVLKMYTYRVTWSFTDNPSNPTGSHIGFRAIFYDEATGPGSPLGDVTLLDPTKRATLFAPVVFNQDATLRAAVEALYVDGIAGALVSSTGTVLAPASAQASPIVVRDSYLTYPYQETFSSSAALPTGMTVGAGVSSSISGGILQLTISTPATAWLEWDIFTWADAYLDSKRTGIGSVLVRIGVTAGRNGAGVLIVGDDGNGNISTSAISGFVDDGVLHNCVAPYANFTFTGTSRAKVRLSLQNVIAGAVVRLDDFTVAIAGVGTVLNGDVDRALKARDQFAKIAPDSTTPGGGLVLKVPTQLVTADGKSLLIGDNGVFFTPNFTTQLQPGYREGARGDLGPITSFSIISLENAFQTAADVVNGVPNVVRPPIREPVAWNKFRVMLQKKGATVLTAAPAVYPVREHIALSNFDGFANLANPKMFFTSVVFFGGNYLSFFDAGPWSQSQTRKSALALNTANGGSIPFDGSFINPDPATDAWYFGKGLLPSLDPATIYYNTSVVVKIVMPNKRNGSNVPYYADLTFVVYIGDGQLDAANNRLKIRDGFRGGPSFRVYTDGSTYTLSMPYSNTIPFIQHHVDGSTVVGTYRYTEQCIAVRWWSLVKQSGSPAGSDPVSVEIAKVDFDYITPNGGTNPSYVGLSSEQYSYVVYNEY